MLPSYIEIHSESEDAEKLRKLQKGGKVKEYKKKKSLGVLCQQFIFLFVTWKPVLSLEDAAKRISECEAPEQ